MSAPWGCPPSRMTFSCGSGGDDYQLVTGVPRLNEEFHGDLLVAAFGVTAVVEVHDAASGVDTGHHHCVVSSRVAVFVLFFDRVVPDEFGVEADDHLVFT